MRQLSRPQWHAHNSPLLGVSHSSCRRCWVSLRWGEILPVAAKRRHSANLAAIPFRGRQSLQAAFPRVAISVEGAITVEGSKFRAAGAISRTSYLFLERHANAVGVYRGELFRAPGLALERAVGMHFASALLVFGIQGFDAFYGEAHHGLVADLARQFFVAHAGYVQVSVAAVDTYIGRRRGVAKSFLEAADLRPPIQGLRCVSGRKNGDRAFYDRVHVRSIIESI